MKEIVEIDWDIYICLVVISNTVKRKKHLHQTMSQIAQVYNSVWDLELHNARHLYSLLTWWKIGAVNTPFLNTFFRVTEARQK